MRMRYNLFLWKGFLPTKPGCYQSSACSSVDQVLKLPFTYSVELTGKQSVMSQVSIFTGNPCKLESCIEPSTCLGLAKYATETRIMKIPAGSHFQGLTLEATNSSFPERMRRTHKNHHCTLLMNYFPSMFLTSSVQWLMQSSLVLLGHLIPDETVSPSIVLQRLQITLVFSFDFCRTKKVSFKCHSDILKRESIAVT